MYIALLEDEIELAQPVKDLLENAGHSVRIFGDGNSLTHAIKRNTFDLFILDWSVPGKSGMEVLRHMREVVKLNSPVLFMTGRVYEEDIVTALSAGADDYCTKPVRMQVLLARVQALLRRSYPDKKEGPTRSLLGYEFNLAEHTVTFNGQTQSLPDKEFSLAIYLFENPERALSRNRLMQEIWGDKGDMLSRALDVYMSGLRKKLAIGVGDSPLRLRPIYGVGYRLASVANPEEE